MNAVVKLGGYISRGVVTVSAPFHPFGGAVDIVVVEQEDGSFKSSPWYVQFGKFQGVLKAKEKVVSINVNGVDADLHMYLDSKGGAYFLREVDGDEEMFESVGSSGDDMDGSSSIRSPQKIVSYNFVGKDREGSMERAEIAADLLEVRWSTSLATRKHRKGSASCNSDPEASIHDDMGSTLGSCRTPKSNGFHDEGDAETPVSTGLANFMESFTLEETYLDPNATEISVGSNGDVQSSSFRVLQGGDDRRLERVDSIYCEASESFMDGLDDYSGESNANMCSSFTVSKKMDVPNVVIGNEQSLNSEFKSSILECEMGMDTEDLEDRNHCRSIEGSKSDSVTATDVETVYETKVEVVVQCNTNEGPVKYVEELIVDQISSNQEPSLSNSFVIEEATISILNSIENLRLQNPSSRHSRGLFQMGSSENNDHLVASMIECNGAAFQVHTTNSVVLEKTEGEQFLSRDLVSSELQRIESMESTSNSITKESNSQDVGVSSEDEMDLSTEKPNETQFCFSDLDGSEVTKTTDTQPVTSDSPEAVNDPRYHPKSSEEKLGESTGTPNESLSFSGHTIQETLHDDHPSSLEMSRSISSPISIGRVPEQVGQTEHTVESLPSFCSHEAKVNRLGANLLLSRSLDSSFDNMRLAQGDVPTTLQTGEQEQQPTPRHSSMENMQISEELRKILSDSAVEISLCRHLLYEGMGHEAAAQVFDAEKLDLEKLVSIGSDIIRNDRLVVRIGRLYFPWDAALPIISAIGSPTGERILPPKGMIIVDEVDNGVETDPQLSTDSRNNTWTIWPFSKTKSTGRRPPLASTVSQRDKAGDTDTAKSESIKKKMAWTKTPTSEQLASLNLKEGRNEVIFTFSTPMLGEQKVDARIYLWKWNARIVISDVDGTITKSDVLGQFMPLVGVDWSHTGVAHLFSAIKENGYEVLFLSARAISQASLTRQFLFNLMQEGKALPEGPVIISPDGLFPSLYREVIRRAPHEFKIACLKDIRDLFPPDQNPFYAGFGNRDTDELSYLKMGIPQGKIFIINPKGEVAVQRRVDRKSYASLHTLVHDMFPPPSTASASEQEDFNQWNFWRLPPPEDV